MARSDPQVNIRMPVELKNRLEDRAKDYGRSLNSEIIVRLEASFEEDEASEALIETSSQMLEALKMLNEAHEEKHEYLRNGLASALKGLKLASKIFSAANGKGEPFEKINRLISHTEYLLDIGKREDIEKEIQEGAAEADDSEVTKPPLHPTPGVDLDQENPLPAKAAMAAKPAQRRLKFRNKPSGDDQQ